MSILIDVHEISVFERLEGVIKIYSFIWS